MELSATRFKTKNFLIFSQNKVFLIFRETQLVSPKS